MTVAPYLACSVFGALLGIVMGFVSFFFLRDYSLTNAVGAGAALAALLWLLAGSGCSSADRGVFDDDDDNDNSGGTAAVGGNGGNGGVGGAPNGGAGQGGSYEFGDPCDQDHECPPGWICNDKVDKCGLPGPLGTPCENDDECQSNLCNDKLDVCAIPAPIGKP